MVEYCQRLEGSSYGQLRLSANCLDAQADLSFHGHTWLSAGFIMIWLLFLQNFPECLLDFIFLLYLIFLTVVQFMNSEVCIEKFIQVTNLLPTLHQQIHHPGHVVLLLSLVSPSVGQEDQHNWDLKSELWSVYKSFQE